MLLSHKRGDNPSLLYKVKKNPIHMSFELILESKYNVFTVAESSVGLFSLKNYL